jgi:predicted small integral membrane protein
MIETRFAKLVMVASLALFAAIVTFDNIFDYGANFQFVRHVLSMDTTFHDSAIMYRAITSPVLWNLAYGIIILGEGLTAVAFIAGAAALWRHRRASAAVFHRAKRPVVIGAAVGFLVWFTGFMVVGGEWFAMWQSQTWNGQQAAFRFYLTLLGVLIFVNQPDGELRSGDL